MKHPGTVGIMVEGGVIRSFPTQPSQPALQWSAVPGVWHGVVHVWCSTFLLKKCPICAFLLLRLSVLPASSSLDHFSCDLEEGKTQKHWNSYFHISCIIIYLKYIKVSASAAEVGHPGVPSSRPVGLRLRTRKGSPVPWPRLPVLTQVIASSGHRCWNPGPGFLWDLEVVTEMARNSSRPEQTQISRKSC